MGKKNWPLRKDLVPGEQLVCRDRITLTPFHIKLEVMKQYFKALNKESKCFKLISKTFPSLSFEKLKQAYMMVHR